MAGNTLRIRRTPKGYYWDTKENRRVSQDIYNLQFTNGHRARKEVFERSYQFVKQGGNPKRAERLASELNEALRMGDELRAQRLEENTNDTLYWNLNEDFQNTNFQPIVKTPSGGTITNRELAAEAYEDMKGIISQVMGKNNENYLTVPVTTDLENKQLIIDFSNMKAYTSSDLDELNEGDEAAQILGEIESAWRALKG